MYKELVERPPLRAPLTNTKTKLDLTKLFGRYHRDNYFVAANVRHFEIPTKHFLKYFWKKFNIFRFSVKNTVFIPFARLTFHFFMPYMVLLLL